MKPIEIEQQQKRIEKAIPFRIFNYTSEEITPELLNEAKLIAAKILRRYGDSYLPLFIRVQNEIEVRKNQMVYKEIALQLLENDSQ